MDNKIKEIKKTIGTAIIGKEEITEKIIATILAGGHILLEDIPGVGKTTLALAFSKALGLTFNRVQFTPDVVPSDITGFTIYDKKSGDFKYNEGSIICNFFLADEINRTSSKTQSALLEVMQESKVTVDGIVHEMPQPFIVIATQNPIGAAGTQMLPEAQLDRFMIQLSMGYPTFNEQVAILKSREKSDPIENIKPVISREDLQSMINSSKQVYMDEKIYKYITMLVETTRKNEYIKLGISPRGAIALASMARAVAFISGRDYAVPEDVDYIFKDVCIHRIFLKPSAKASDKTKEQILEEILNDTTAPKVDTETNF